MKKQKLIVFGFGIALLISACRKNDIHEAKTTSVPTVATPAVSNWISLSNWTKQSEENYAVYSNKIEDKAITTAVAEDGLILAFKKTGNTITALPVEEKGDDNSYFWYYQVAEGSLLFNADAYGTTETPGATQSFKYYIISSDQLKELELKGYSKAELMRLTYENAQALLK